MVALGLFCRLKRDNIAKTAPDIKWDFLGEKEEGRAFKKKLELCILPELALLMTCIISGGCAISGALVMIALTVILMHSRSAAFVILIQVAGLLTAFVGLLFVFFLIGIISLISQIAVLMAYVMTLRKLRGLQGRHAKEQK